jgi:uncharacterized protein YprB with RNaseH-like and TPR domain
MGSNLKNRLRLIRESGTRGGGTGSNAVDKHSNTADVNSDSAQEESLPGDDWVPAGFKAARRTVVRDFAPPKSAPLPRVFPAPLPIIIPDLFRYFADDGTAGKLHPEDLCFFDLETTGLSTAAGTVAFLAAFGRFVFTETGAWRLRVEQYLLLDFPGENDFLEASLKEFTAPAGARPPLIVSYNGKTFDAQILKTRCLMMGFPVPEYHHADLLHPARRLWRRVLPSCSQGVIEVEVLGLDREGDVSGAEAPDIWFDFLKTGATEKLRDICDHNLKDIAGLASLFAALADIAARPLETHDGYRADLERLALHWHKACRHDRLYSVSPRFGEGEYEAGKALLDSAVEKGYPLAVTGRAIEAEWRERDPAKALALVETALAREDIPDGLRDALLVRRERLRRKSAIPEDPPGAH